MLSHLGSIQCHLVVGHHGGSASNRGFEGVREIFLALFFQK